MPRIRIGNVLSHLESDLRKAMEQALSRAGATSVDARALTKEFIKAVERKCSTWERVSENDVEMD
jgi:hypothetical protein